MQILQLSVLITQLIVAHSYICNLVRNAGGSQNQHQNEEHKESYPTAAEPRFYSFSVWPSSLRIGELHKCNLINRNRRNSLKFYRFQYITQLIVAIYYR